MKLLSTTLFISAVIEITCGRVLPLEDEQIAKVGSWKPGDKGYPWEFSGQTQGDIVFTREQQRNGLVNTRYRWPNKTLVYQIDASVNAEDRATIEAALQYFPLNTCIQVKERTQETDFVKVNTSGPGCWSWYGRIGGEQGLALQTPGCVYTGTILHEFLHALGFVHMQSATDRDDFIEILYDNITPGYESNFVKYDNSYIDTFGETYDLQSVMHYSEYAFSSNGLPTIRAWDGTSPLGNNAGLTDKDRNKLMTMYEC